MPLSSMTGYGRGEAKAGPVRVEAELSSVNRRQFEVRVSLPRHLSCLEARVCERVQAALSRGSVTGVIRVTRTGAGACRGEGWVNVPLAAAYVAALRRCAAELGIEDDLTARSLAALPGVLEGPEEGGDPEIVWPLVDRALRAALDGLLAMRRAEGAALERDLRARLGRLRRVLKRVQKRAPQVPARYLVALRRRVAALGAAVERDDALVARELALFADRSDISEELVRAESHLAQADKLVASAKPVGRALDFLCQELFREINTMGSKANDVRVSRHAVALKAELEAIREQVQNVE